MNPCSFGNQEISIHGSISLIVECPTCGVIRTVKSTGDGRHVYPEHKELEGTARERPRWKQVDGQWAFIDQKGQ